MTITLDVLNRFQENKVWQTAHTQNKIARFKCLVFFKPLIFSQVNGLPNRLVHRTKAQLRSRPLDYKIISISSVRFKLVWLSFYSTKLSSLLKLERCQYWFLKHTFYVPEFAPGPLLLKLSGLSSIESEVAIKMLFFLGRMITEPKMTPLIKNLFDSGTKSFFDSDHKAIWSPIIAESLKKFDPFYYFETWYNNSIFPTYPNWKNIVRDNILHFVKPAWHSYFDTHPEMQIASSCLATVTLFYFWSLADHFPDLVECTLKLDLWANSVLVVVYHGSATRMEHFAVSTNKTLKAWLTSFLTVVFSNKIFSLFGDI